jgi:hypothetical protein
VNTLSLDYGALLGSFDRQAAPQDVGAVFANAAAASYYAKQERACALLEFDQAGAKYWFDLASSADLPQADRTVAAWALTPKDIHGRDSS